MDPKELAESIISYWKKTDAFNKSVQSRPESMSFTFFDGPPFTSGDPHYGHLLQSILKDMVPRWMTMRGYHVKRKWGWDCHGIPAENYVNKQLGITSKKQVEDEIGIQKYIEACRTMVNDVNENWQWTVDHIGRWVDMENAYFTMNTDYMESVIAVFSDLYHRNLIYKGFKVLGYSWALGTPLSNHEINEGYEMRQDPAVTIKLPLLGKDNGFENNKNDGANIVAGGVIRNEDGAILCVFDKKFGRRWLPGGKVEQGESPVEAMKREVKEELGVEVTSHNKLGAVTLPNGGELWQLMYFDVEVDGKPKNMEPEKQGDIGWVSRVDADNELGYAMKVNDLIIDEVERIHAEFKDHAIIEEKMYELGDDDKTPTSLLAWTTTPWTLPSNMFAAVHNDIQYVVLFDHDENESFVIAKDCISSYYKSDENYTILYHTNGASLVGLAYEPPFDYYYQHDSIDKKYKEQVHHIVHADFVTTEAGTGIAHEAPAFGEDDYDLVATIFPKEKAKYWLFDPVDEHGAFTDLVPDWSGENIFEANKPIIKDLKDRGVIVKHETINHSYPHCPRTGTPLMYKAIESWFVKENELKEKTLPSSEEMLFVPETVKKRFYNGLESAPDWNISRTRYWGAPLPVWENPEKPEERLVVGSIEEIYEYNKDIGQIKKVEEGGKVSYIFNETGKPVDLHRPYIDEIILVHPETGNKLQRIPEVLDCWFESGSMPFAQDHMMKDDAVKNPPVADFIAEGLDQTRGWFRALHVLGNAYIDGPVFKNVVVTGMILAEDGKKMSKSLQNYPDPSHILNEYGADALRLYMLSSPVVRAEPLRFEEQGVEQMLKDFVIPLENVWNFFKTYADVDDWQVPDTQVHYMRHAHCPYQQETERTKDTPITEQGVEQVTSEQFKEKILRIRPEVIISSDHQRTIDTASAVQKIMRDYADTDPGIIETDKLGTAMTQENAGLIYKNILEEHKGKSILIVSHKKRFRFIWQSITGFDGNINDKDIKERLFINPCDIVPLPIAPLENELDQWIYAELHAMMQELNNDLKEYQIEPATKTLIAFVEKLTNWYVRRSRRRFWASGMGPDKQSGYQTLWSVLRTFLKVSAPFVPFITEHIWQEMGEEGSIHNEYRPVYASQWVNDELIKEISLVRKIIKGALYLRAKNEIKVKQPLKELKFSL